MVNDSSDEDAGDWGKTQLVEDSDEERDDDGDDELSVGTQVLSDDEDLSNDEGEVKFCMNGSNAKVNSVLEGHVDTNNFVDSDASTDEEGGTARVSSEQTRELAAACQAFTANSLQQGNQQASIKGANLLRKTVENSTSCSRSVGDHRDCGIDSDSHGYVQNHDKDGTKSRSRCSTAKKLFADTMVEEGKNNGRCFDGLSYVESQEPGDLSQANALEVVDRLISINAGISSQEPTPQKLDSAKPPHVSYKRGTLMLAEKVDCNRNSNGKAEIFAWVDSREDDGGAGRGKSKSHFPREKKCSTKVEAGGDKIGECKKGKNSKLSGKSDALPLSDSRIFNSDLKSKRASGNRTKKNLLKDLDLDDLSNGKNLEETQEKVSVALHDVGPDTQIALEAMEALAQCSPAKILSAKDESPLGNRKSKKAKSESKNDPCQKRTGSIQGGVTTRSKRIKLTELTPEPEKEMHKGSRRRKNSGDLKAKAKDKQAKLVPTKSKVLKISSDGNKCDAPVSHRTRHFSRNNLDERTEICSNKHSKRVINSTGGISMVGEVQNNHIANEFEQPMISERTTKSASIYVEKESTEHTSATDAQHLQLRRDGSSQHTSDSTAQGLEPCRNKPTIEVTCIEYSSHHPKQRRTPTKFVKPKDPAVTQNAINHETPQDEARPSKKRRVFIRSVSDYLKYAKRESSNGRSTSLLSTIIKKSSTASPALYSSVSADSKTSGFNSSENTHNGPSQVEDASKSPRSNSDFHSSALKTPSKLSNELSPTFSPLNPVKSSSRSLSKLSVARELLTLDPEKNPSNCQHKDSRRKKKPTSFSILFSHHLHGDVIKRQKKFLARLGLCEALSIPDATHFVADSFFRTKNMLEAIALGKLVVTSMWLENCDQAGCFIDEKKYILRDAKKEREIGFSMPKSLASACKHPLLLGKRVFVTPNVKPSRDVVICLVLASSGQPLERIGRSITKEVPDDLLVISCEEDYETCSPLLKRGASVFESELLLNGIVIQKLDYERHRLFSDRVKQTRSTRWLKDTAHGRFVPVSKCT
uniref:BRCT domain-containing protein n=1 Tax=Oryza brachyantha TaxID=4533 RepID=J3M3Y3_ORYBR